MKVIPLGFLPTFRKRIIVAILAMFLIVPALISPLVWKVNEGYTLRNSRVFLDAFCRYLDTNSKSSMSTTPINPDQE